MAALATLSSTDGTTSYFYNIKSHGPSSVVWTLSTAASEDSADTVELLTLPGKKNSPIRRTRVKTTYYYLETAINGSAEGYVAPPKVAFINQFVTDAIIHRRSTFAQNTYGRRVHGFLIYTSTGNGIEQIADAMDKGRLPY